MLMLQCDIIIFTAGGNKLRISYCFSKTGLGNKVKADRGRTSATWKRSRNGVETEEGVEKKKKKTVQHAGLPVRERTGATRREKDIAERRFFIYVFMSTFRLKFREKGWRQTDMNKVKNEPSYPRFKVNRRKQVYPTRFTQSSGNFLLYSGHSEQLHVDTDCKI